MKLSDLSPGQRFRVVGIPEVTYSYIGPAKEPDYGYAWATGVSDCRATMYLSTPVEVLDDPEPPPRAA